MHFSVESWAPQYGASITSPSAEDADHQVDVTVERPLHDWAPIDTGPVTIPDEIVFIDGIQRIDARIWIHHDGIPIPAVCASLAAGAVVCWPDGAVTEGVRIARALIAPASSIATPIITRHATYEMTPARDATPEAAYLTIHSIRQELETSVARSINHDLIVFDGPLRGHHPQFGVGYVKTHHKIYLPQQLQPLLGSLNEGQRTPIFFLSSGPSGARWSWYLRLPGPAVHPLAGIVRLELPGTGSAAVAARRAALVSSSLPRYASEPHKEPRAPQNLYPIAGLEQQLSRRLGDPLLLERALRVAATPQSQRTRIGL